jgi:protein-disulfide isomerase
MSKIWAGWGVAALIVVIGGGYYFWQSPTPQTAPATTMAPAATPAAATAPAPSPPPQPQSAQGGPQPRADDRVLGKADAPIVIFEFASLTCPHCADFDANTLPKLKADWIDTGKARLIFRDFPLEPMAIQAATLARCAPPDQFYGFIDALFRGQANWASPSRIQDALGKIAKLAGMSDEKYAACMKDDALRDQILGSRLEAEQQFKVESTPTFFINGTRFVGALPYPEFEAALNKAAAK